MYPVLAPAEMRLGAGRRLGPYRLLSTLKRGGMSTVYLGYHLRTGQRVAIKVVESDSPYLEYLYREIHIMQALHHDCILPCIEAGRFGLYHYLVMPYLGGGTLQDLIEDRPLTLEEASILLEHLTSALAYLHARGILHRDIKPSNIFLDEASLPYLADFGIASRLGEGCVRHGQVMGTAKYMAPEVFEGQVDERSEVYAVGILLYQMLSGHLPFDGENWWKMYRQHKEEPPLCPSFYTPSLPRGVEQVIVRALEKDPHHRFPSMEDLFAAFQKALAPSFFDQLTSRLHQASQQIRQRLVPDTNAWPPVTSEQPVLPAS